MKLNRLLEEKESDILKSWVNSILEQYHVDTRKFLVKNHDQFTNPVGHTLFTATENLFRELRNDKDFDPDRFEMLLDRLIRTRAIQDFTPSQCISFLFSLKKMIRKKFKKEIRDNNLSDELIAFENKIDEIVLVAFDVYMKCREKLYEIAAFQAKNQVSSLLRKKGLVSEIPEWDPHRLKENKI
jgi:hypothetical protein